MVYQYTLEEAVDDRIEYYSERADSDGFEACLDAAGPTEGMWIALGLLGLDKPERAVPAFRYLVPKWLNSLDTRMKQTVEMINKGQRRELSWEWHLAAFVAALSSESDLQQEVGDVLYKNATHPIFNQLETPASRSHDLTQACGALLSGRNNLTTECERIIEKSNEMSGAERDRPDKFTGQAMALLAIRRGNRDEFIEAIELWFDYLDPILESKKRAPRSDKDPIRDRVDITASALIALARQHGLDVQVDHDVVPKAVHNQEYYPLGQ